MISLFPLRHFRISTLGTVLLFCSSAALANSNTISNSPFTGPYIGVYGGYDWSDADTDTGGNPDINGWDWGGFAGMKIDGLLDRVNGLGIGLNGALEGSFGTSSADGAGLEKEREWGVSFRPGLSFLDKALDPVGVNPYGILGYRNTKFTTVTTSDWHNGFELGIGTELLAHGKWGVRLEYAHVWYGEKSGIDPDSDDVRLGLSYHF